MLLDRQVFDRAMDFVGRSENLAGDPPLSNAYMQTAALLLLVVELRRLNSRLDELPVASARRG